MSYGPVRFPMLNNGWVVKKKTFAFGIGMKNISKRPVEKWLQPLHIMYLKA